MTHTARHLLALAALLGAGTVARAQAPDLLPPLARPSTLSATNPGQVPGLPPLPAPESTPPRPAPSFQPFVPPPEWLPAAFRVAPQTDPLGCAFREPDPLLEDPRWPPLGWFVDAELGFGGTHIRNRLVNILQVGPATFDVVRVPGAALDWAVMPRFDVGYRLPHSLGEFLVSYQFLSTQGSTDLVNPMFASHQTSRLNWNVFDFDYANRQQELVPCLDMRWRIGVRLASMYFDNRADQPGAALFGGPVEQRATNYIVGAGPHVAGEFSRPVNVPGLSVYIRSELAWLYVHLHQHFEEGFAGPVPFPPPGAVVDARNSQGVGFLGIQAGVHWTPPVYPTSHLFFGYLFQGWSQVGRNDNNGSYADIFQNGIFLRGEINF